MTHSGLRTWFQDFTLVDMLGLIALIYLACLFSTTLVAIGTLFVNFIQACLEETLVYLQEGGLIIPPLPVEEEEEEELVDR